MISDSGGGTRRPGLEYFPAASLSHGERSCFNFGACPFRHRVAGFHAVQPPPPSACLRSARYLVSCLRRLMPTLARDDIGGEVEQEVVARDASEPSEAAVKQQWQREAGWLQDGTAMLVADECLGALGDVLSSPGTASAVHFLVSDTIVPFLLELMGSDSGGAGGEKMVCAALETLVACLDPEELTAVVGVSFECCAARCRSCLLGSVAARDGLRLARLLAANRHVLGSVEMLPPARMHSPDMVT